MQYIWYEYLSESYPKFRAYKVREGNDILQYVLHEKLRDVLREAEQYPKYEQTFMLDESRFSFFRFDIFESFDDKFKLENLKEIIAIKTKEIREKNGVNLEKIVSYIDNIYVNGEEKKFVIGEQGEIFFRLYIVCLQKTSLNEFNSIYGNVLSLDNINIVPQSFNTLLFLRNNLKKENFLLLYINETYCKAIKVHQGFYQDVEILNLGVNSLKQMYKDNGIVQYRYKSYEFIESNSLAKSLVLQTLEFYSQLFCKWIYERGFGGTDVIVISSITKNVHFLEAFNKEYAKFNNNYIVPFHHSEYLDYFGREREPDDMDALVYLNKQLKVET